VFGRRQASNHADDDRRLVLSTQRAHHSASCGGPEVDVGEQEPRRQKLIRPLSDGGTMENRFVSALIPVCKRSTRTPMRADEGRCAGACAVTFSKIVES
jgi:hypothetical protein